MKQLPVKETKKQFKSFINDAYMAVQGFNSTANVNAPEIVKPLVEIGKISANQAKILSDTITEKMHTDIEVLETNIATSVDKAFSLLESYSTKLVSDLESRVSELEKRSSTLSRKK